jgi:hypothetical protein
MNRWPAMNRWSRNGIAVLGVGLLGATLVACELAVQLDRSRVNAGDDAGCTICSAPIEGEGGDDSAAEDGATDATLADAALADATPDSPTIDASVDAGR